MIVRVLQYAFGQGEVREVELENIPTDVPESQDHVDGLVDHLLEEVFYYGQNEHQNVKGRYSVSMGDVAELWGKRYLCCSMGWKEMSDDELEAWKLLNVSQRHLSLLCQS